MLCNTMPKVDTKSCPLKALIYTPHTVINIQSKKEVLYFTFIVVLIVIFSCSLHVVTVHV